MIIVKPPTPMPLIHRNIVFLAGSIEQGTADNWQRTVERSLSDIDGILLNPRREEWDASWVQDISNPQFYEQVSWELDGIEKATKILMYFAPDTKSPITLLELGIITKFPEKAIVCCPSGFWRKGNVDIVCEKFKIQTAKSLNDLTDLAYDQLVD